MASSNVIFVFLDMTNLYIVTFFRLNRNNMRFSRFVFDRVESDWAKGVFKFYYGLDDEIELCEVLTLPSMPVPFVKTDVLEAALFNLHLALGVSYYKIFCPPECVVRSGVLSPRQAEFWNRTYTRGLGEFFYKNKVDFRGLVRFPSDAIEVKNFDVPLEERLLVPFSGGKDSIVSVELLKQAGLPMDLFYMGRANAIEKVVQLTGETLLNVKRELDPKLPKLTSQGMNGHVPLNAILAFLSTFVALVYKYRAIALSNESSASEGNVDYLGETVNHQYSKSFEFERDFQDYYAEFVSPSVHYFSLLRPMNELQIARELSRHPRYFGVFSSCNRNFKQEGSGQRLIWCGTCPKCAFVFLVLAPFLEADDLVGMFGRNLLDDDSLWPTYQALLGLTAEKPFECVGTPQEVRAAFQVLSSADAFKNTALVRRVETLHLPLESMDELLKMRSPHAIPSFILNRLP